MKELRAYNTVFACYPSFEQEALFWMISRPAFESPRQFKQSPQSLQHFAKTPLSLFAILVIGTQQRSLLSPHNPHHTDSPHTRAQLSKRMRHRDDELLKTLGCCQRPSINTQLIPHISCFLPSTAIPRHTLQGTSTKYAFCNTTTPCPRCPASLLGLISGLNPTTSTLFLVRVSLSQEKREEREEEGHNVSRCCQL